jgi:DNA-binding NarL/FixJ family response regulator
VPAKSAQRENNIMDSSDATGSESLDSHVRRRLRIVLVDEHEIFREAVRTLIGASEEFDVVGEAGRATDALHLIGSLRPDVVLTDFRVPEMSGMQFTAEIRSRFPDATILVLTALHAHEYVAAAKKAGASGYVLKNCDRGELFAALREVAAGRHYACKSLAEAPSRAGSDNLTERQRQVLRFVALGYANREIAQMLGVSLKAVQKHRERLRENLQLQSTAALTRFAVTEGLI